MLIQCVCRKYAVSFWSTENLGGLRSLPRRGSGCVSFAGPPRRRQRGTRGGGLCHWRTTPMLRTKLDHPWPLSCLCISFPLPRPCPQATKLSRVRRNSVISFNATDSNNYCFVLVEASHLYSPSCLEEVFSETELPVLPYSRQLMLYAGAAAV